MQIAKRRGVELEQSDSMHRLSQLSREMDDAEDQLQMFFRLSHDMLCIINGNGFFKRINPRWEDVLGWPTDELLRTPFMGFLHPQDRKATTDSLEQLRAEPLGRFVNRFRTRNGEYRVLEWSASKYTEDGFTYAVARDITETCGKCPHSTECLRFP